MTMPERESLDPTALALPPLRHGPTTDASWDNPPTKHVTLASVQARERIFQSRIAELESLWQSAEACYAEADAAAMAHAKRIAELEAVLVKFDERWLMDGELGFCVACGVSIEGGDAHKPECWLTEARAAIDAAREAKL